MIRFAYKKKIKCYDLTVEVNDAVVVSRIYNKEK